MNIRESVRNMKTVSPVLAASSAEVRNEALIKIAEALAAHAEEIFAANRKDLAAADEKGIAPAVKKRLLYSEGKMQDSVAGLRQLASLPDPLGKVTLDRELDEGLRLTRVTCPIGVIGVIFEARPDALVQISSLCLKSGNCAVLKGGKETAETNRVLFEVIYRAAVAAGLPEGCLLLAEQHSEIDELLTCDKEVDLLIPRGSNAFVRYIMDHTKIPVMGHADGICHIFVDKDADQDKAIRVIIDAKTQYTAACNAVETILVDRAIAGEFLPKLAAAFEAAGIKMRGTAEVSEITPCEVMGEEDFATEYLDLIASVKLVDGVAEAVRHINYFGSHHTDSVMTENEETAAYFTQMVDSAGVYVNVSTRFADGFRYGFGAEVGISTGKIHARGPVGLEGLVTYKYRLTGDGHIVGDYASGKRTFHHRDL
ncbi:MAG: glutamate-5-semialdehyde dehydrogenase [Lachnospiraceae bacterium]|jgi:glutamate-5-semialdehyde dehydrogenase|nr:glutamate-5-semialdehyde dehydrogenase [Lachnospiraceae bacterium]